MDKPVVIGIAGGSGSGKSTVLRRIVEAVGAERVCVLDHDSYYRDLSHLPFGQRIEYNFDHPNALETSLMCRHLDELLEWKSVEKPVYNFKTHTRDSETRRVAPRPVILVEGILVLAEEELARRM
ncbi:MAG: uridine kinase, partial [Rhodothermales bacterium]